MKQQKNYNHLFNEKSAVNKSFNKGGTIGSGSGGLSKL